MSESGLEQTLVMALKCQEISQEEARVVRSASVAPSGKVAALIKILARHIGQGDVVRVEGKNLETATKILGLVFDSSDEICVEAVRTMVPNGVVKGAKNVRHGCFRMVIKGIGDPIETWEHKECFAL